MMKRLICMLLCLILALPAAMAETADTLPKLFVRQLTAGYGIRGYTRLTASGVAEWLNVLMPFIASDIQIRAIGEKQGDESAYVSDDDDWQIKLYAVNSADQEVGTTWVYGDPEGIYLQSALLPEKQLCIPVSQVQLLYQVFKGEYKDLFFAFDPFDMKLPGANGNVAAYEAVAEMLGIPANEWTTKWMPVLEKYLLQLDLWLSSYGDTSIFTSDSGKLTMSATYEIPADDIKAEAKYLLGQMLFDNDLQTLLLPYVTMEQRVTYLNPGMVYFYEACIDALDIQGKVVLSREMSAQGETVSTKVSLPIPALPETITAPINAAAVALFQLPYDDLLAGVNYLTMIQNGDQMTLRLEGDKRTISLVSNEALVDADTVHQQGSIRITPNVGVEENSLSAAFEMTYAHKKWQDDNYLDHDMTSINVSVTPDLSMLSEDDPFRNAYVDFAPLAFEASVDYRNNTFQQDKPVQININAHAKLPDAEIGMETVLRITTKLTMTHLAAAEKIDLLKLSEEDKKALLAEFTENAIVVMSNLNAPVAEASEVTEAEPTEVPPMTE